jgi:dGTPase
VITTPPTTVRTLLEERERTVLSPLATLSAESRGRATPEPEHEYRTSFQRDRERILHSKAFRRLKRKTQVFLAAEGDHYRTRLTHTLEVAQIARAISRALFLNEDLTEAIALGHDLGHAPFGHAGEAVLNDVASCGFVHSEQSVRIVEKLEQRSAGPGLNLTFEVLDGIRNHSKGKVLLLGREGDRAMTPEGNVVSLADAIAYINHDIEDACRAGIMTIDSLPKDAAGVLGRNSSQRINAMVSGVIRGSGEGGVNMLPEIREATQALRMHLFKHVYPSAPILFQVERARKLLREIYDYYMKNPTAESTAGDPGDSLERRTVDFIAGMTDQYAIQQYERLFLPSAWRI